MFFDEESTTRKHWHLRKLLIPGSGMFFSDRLSGCSLSLIVTYPRDRIKAVLFIFVFPRITFIPAGLLIGVWFLIQLVHTIREKTLARFDYINPERPRLTATSWRRAYGKSC